ncbi:conserved domain protein [Coleofasciculus chthonoplastes PCC 7420]|uniref:Conserved domain protein n=2 Tax=Coleofasciculaceae TaxID=1892251 RepID=B4VI18_9CYAN|nr:conserved domain protein [Coleofasciculus chthonoplastes PCC 7420]
MLYKIVNSYRETFMTTQKSSSETVSTEGLSTEEMVPTEFIQDKTTVNYVETIETVISSLEQDDSAMVSHNDEGYLWKFKYGSVEVFVQLTGSTDEDTFTVWSSVLNLPAEKEAELMRRLLEMNWSDTFESRFGIVDDQVVVLSSRTVAELSPGEISRAITIVATIADDNDEALQEEFGAA